MPSDYSPGQSARDSFDAGPAYPARDPNPPTIAPFSPSTSSPASKSKFQVTKKSPLLVATPPQITRALSQSYPYINVFNKIMGLLTWTTKDPWESFLLVAVFWGIVLYGEQVALYGGNVVVVLGIAVGLWMRSYKEDEIHPSLDQILETQQTFTARLDIFFEPFYSLTAFLSTGRTPTTATTVPAVTTLAIRMLLVTPIWLLLAVWPFHIITGRRIIMVAGTLILSWHSRPAKVTRTVMWRSLTIRWVAEQLTGLNFTIAPTPTPPPLPPRNSSGSGKQVGTPSAGTPVKAAGTPTGSLRSKNTPLKPGGVHSPGVKFTFVIYENQRRWLGLGWNTSLFAYERAPWTDESLAPCPPPSEFTLPVTPAKSGVKWRWVKGDEWRIDGADGEARKGGHGANGKKQAVKDKLGGGGVEGEGWIYYDNKWNHGTRDGGDGWSKYTRRRKWIRNAELVEDDSDQEEEEDDQGDQQRQAVELDGQQIDATHHDAPPAYVENLGVPVPSITVTSDDEDEEDNCSRGGGRSNNGLLYRGKGKAST